MYHRQELRPDSLTSATAKRLRKTLLQESKLSIAHHIYESPETVESSRYGLLAVLLRVKSSHECTINCNVCST
jgi:hypothetical protein